MFLGVAAIGYALAFRLKIPSVPLLILLGYGLSLLPIAPDSDFSRNIVEFGLAFLVFSAGIELSPRRFAHQTSAVLWVSVVQFVLVGLLAFLAVRWLGYSELASIYVGFAVSASSTLVVIRHLRQQQQMFQPFGRLVTGVLLVQDIALILLLTGVVAASAGASFVTLSTALGGLLLLALVAIFCHYQLLPRLTASLRSDDETLLLVGLAILSLFIAAAALLGIPFIAGAFLAGFALSSFPGNGLMRGLIGSLTDFFQALFFTALGTLLVVSSFATIWHAVLLAVLVFVITPPLVAFVAEWRGQSSRSGIESGLLLAQTSELGIVFALIGMQLGHVGNEEFTVLALVAAITMTLTPFVATDAVTWKLLHIHPSRQKKPAPMNLKDHVLVLGFGSAGMWGVKPLRQAGHEVLVVDEDPTVIENLEKMKIPCLRADGSDEHILEMVRARDAKLILASVPRLGDLQQIIRYAKGVKVVARVFEDTEVRIIERAGGIAISNAEAAEEAFASWFANFLARTDAGEKSSK